MSGSNYFTAVVDFGKTNKKVLIYDRNFAVQGTRREVFEEIEIEGYRCDDLEGAMAFVFEAIENLGRAIIDGDFKPGFMVKLLQKDLGIVLDAAKNLHLPLSGTALCHQYFRSCEAHQEADLGTQAMYHVLERLGNLSNDG